MAFFMKITFLVLSLILAFTRKEFILIGDLAFGGRTSVMVLVLIEIADAFIDRKNNSTQVNKKEQFTARACLKNKSCTKHIFPRPFS